MSPHRRPPYGPAVPTIVLSLLFLIPAAASLFTGTASVASALSPLGHAQVAASSVTGPPVAPGAGGAPSAGTTGPAGGPSLPPGGYVPGGGGSPPDPARGPSPHPFATGAPATDINGSAHINGSLDSSLNYLSGTVNIVGEVSTSGWTQTQGWADYGGTVVNGAMTIQPVTPGGTVFATHGGSSLWVDPTATDPTAVAVMQGNIAIGNPATGDSVLMTTVGTATTLTIDANKAGGIYSYPSGNNNLNSGGNIVVTNFGNSTGSITLNCNIILICPISVGPGSSFTPPLGISASSSSITWGANTHFSITGDTSSGGAGVTASMPDTRMDVTIAAGGNLSLTKGGGLPSLTVAPGATWPAFMVTVGHSTVSTGEHLTAANVVDQGTFTADQTASNGGTFYNDGGLAITGHIDAAGEQLFPADLTIGPSVNITSYPGGNITNTGTININSVASIQGLSVAQGTLTIAGTLAQGPAVNAISGTVSVNGTMSTQGYVSTSGTTLFSGNVYSAGNLGLPSAYISGALSLTGGTFLGQGTTALSGSTLGVGLTTVTTTGYSTVGTTTLTGNIQSTGSIAVNGTSVITTAPGAWFHLSHTVQMGLTSSGGWTSQVVGNVFSQGTSFSNGSASFSSTLVTFPPGLSVHGTAWTSGNVTVHGSSVFDGNVASNGVSRFPGTVLVGSFSLTAPGSVVSTGTAWVSGNVSLVGVLQIGVGLFQETGTSTITGNLDITGAATISGASVISTGTTGALHLRSTVLMGAQGGGFTSRVVGSVMTQGTVFSNGTATFNATTASFPPGLSVHGAVSASGNVTVVGSTLFQGSVATSGVSKFPGATLVGSFDLPAPGTINETGTNWVEGNVSLTGLLSVGLGSFTETGASSISGYADLAGPVTIVGNGYMTTGSAGAFHMSGQVEMGTVSTVSGTVMTQGTVFANGTSTFTYGLAKFPVGLTVHGLVESQGNISVHGDTDFTGAVTTSGNATFPGMSLSGTFALSAVGGSVNTTNGASQVLGNISLDGVLTIQTTAFEEVGNSVITGSMVMTGTVIVNGDSTLTTTPGTLLDLSGNIQLASAAHIIGNVNTSGDVTISGSAILSSTSVVIGGAMSLNGWVVSRGIITLTGTADFQGPVLTQGHTSLSGLGVAGNFSLHWGEFHLAGTVSLTGTTVAEGSVVANSSGYYVVGSSRIDGMTNVSGSAWVRGASSTVGYVELLPGSQFGTYMVVNGELKAGSLDLQGPVVLPDDTVTFSTEANITGSVWENGLLTSADQVTTFLGESIINGTATSAGAPTVQGPVDLPLEGTPFALTLGPTFYLLIVLLLVAPVVGLIEVGRLVARRRKPLSEPEKQAVRRLRPLAAGSAVLLAAGVGVGLGGSFWLGSLLTSPDHASFGALVPTVELVGALLLLAGVVLWGAHRVVHRSRRRQARSDGVTEATAYSEEFEQGYDPNGPMPGFVQGAPGGYGYDPNQLPPGYDVGAGAPYPVSPGPPPGTEGLLPSGPYPGAEAAAPLDPAALPPDPPGYAATPPPAVPLVPGTPPGAPPIAVTPSPRPPVSPPGRYITERQRRAMEAAQAGTGEGSSPPPGSSS